MPISLVKILAGVLIQPITYKGSASPKYSFGLLAVQSSLSATTVSSYVVGINKPIWIRSADCGEKFWVWDLFRRLRLRLLPAMVMAWLSKKAKRAPAATIPPNRKSPSIQISPQLLPELRACLGAMPSQPGKSHVGDGVCCGTFVPIFETGPKTQLFGWAPSSSLAQA